ncbi:MAG: hypothetical protein HC775_06760 [Hyellaceae cyanobacterium CSU_1_1]|nr:hypothetical protein [Hyellaceae cyanobacterium CSU_1_1]
MKVRVKWMQQSLLDLMHGKKYWQPIKFLIKLIIPQQNFRRRIMSSLNQNVIFASTEPISPKFKNELKQAFKQEVISLSEFIDRDLVTLWGYESLNSELGKVTSIKYKNVLK